MHLTTEVSKWLLKMLTKIKKLKSGLIKEEKEVNLV